MQQNWCTRVKHTNHHLVQSNSPTHLLFDYICWWQWHGSNCHSSAQSTQLGNLARGNSRVVLGWLWFTETSILAGDSAKMVQKWFTNGNRTLCNVISTVGLGRKSVWWKGNACITGVHHMCEQPQGSLLGRLSGQPHPSSSLFNDLIIFGINTCKWLLCIIVVGSIILNRIGCICSNVSSKRLSKRMQSHIVCICLTFSHRVLSNVPSNCLPERMQSHIGCICLTFPHCVFSNVSSNYLPQKMHNCTDSICLTFLHCAFSNVSSNYLGERMQPTLVAFVCLFSTVQPRFSDVTLACKDGRVFRLTKWPTLLSAPGASSTCSQGPLYSLGCHGKYY